MCILYRATLFFINLALYVCFFSLFLNPNLLNKPWAFKKAWNYFILFLLCFFSWYPLHTQHHASWNRIFLFPKTFCPTLSSVRAPHSTCLALCSPVPLSRPLPFTVPNLCQQCLQLCLFPDSLGAYLPGSLLLSLSANIISKFHIYPSQTWSTRIYLGMEIFHHRPYDSTTF